MVKRIFIFTLIICILLSATVNCFAADPYWAWLSKYTNATNTNNIDAIISCANEIRSIYSKPSTKDEYTRIANPNLRAARDCEKAGRFSDARKHYQVTLDCYKWLHQHGVDYYDSIINIQAILLHLEGYLDVYTVSQQPTDVPYFKALNEPEKATYFGMCNSDDDKFYSAKLVYVSFFIENIRSYKKYFENATDNEIIEVAWNVPNETKEDLDKILSGKWDEYIYSNIEYLNSTGRKILLRFGAEINCWKSLPTSKADFDARGKQFCDTFKAAFRHIADIVHKKAPNCAMVYSPNDVSNRYFTIEDFYPGDKYVDWVGLSTYDTYSEGGEWANGNDAYYFTGKYDNQILRIKKIVDTFGVKKPILISECGFPYKSTSSKQDLNYALNKLKYFYTYVNMVYPQVKAIFYFNANFGGNSYKLNGDDGNSTMGEAYYSAVSQNPSMNASANPEGAKYYTKLENYNQDASAIKLYAFAYFPGNDKIKVTYSLSGSATATYSTTQYPYNYTLPKLKEGTYTVTVKAEYGKNVISKAVTLYVDKNGKAAACGDRLKDIKSGSWYEQYAKYSVAHGIFTGTSDTTFHPNQKITRAQFVQVLANLVGVDTSNRNVTTSFKDVPSKKWFTSAVKWASENKVVNGMGDGKFEPNANVTREQMCVMLVNFAKFKNITLKAVENKENFTDDTKISQWAKTAVYICQQADIVNGKGKGNFDPKGTGTRAEACVIFTKLHKDYMTE